MGVILGGMDVELNELTALTRIQWRIQDFEKGGSYYSVREERQKFLPDHAHFCETMPIKSPVYLVGVRSHEK